MHQVAWRWRRLVAPCHHPASFPLQPLGSSSRLRKKAAGQVCVYVQHKQWNRQHVCACVHVHNTQWTLSKCRVTNDPALNPAQNTRCHTQRLPPGHSVLGALCTTHYQYKGNTITRQHKKGPDSNKHVQAFMHTHSNIPTFTSITVLHTHARARAHTSTTPHTFYNHDQVSFEEGGFGSHSRGQSRDKGRKVTSVCSLCLRHQKRQGNQ
jgi:hypothetical protein